MPQVKMHHVRPTTHLPAHEKAARQRRRRENLPGNPGRPTPPSARHPNQHATTPSANGAPAYQPGPKA